jgi:hypothetical protein
VTGVVKGVRMRVAVVMAMVMGVVMRAMVMPMAVAADGWSVRLHARVYCMLHYNIQALAD